MREIVSPQRYVELLNEQLRKHPLYEVGMRFELAGGPEYPSGIAMVPAHSGAEKPIAYADAEHEVLRRYEVDLGGQA
ncbi:MAG: hypothetical protein AB7L90_25785 [Hyphomicrobiaceae bacterium]